MTPEQYERLPRYAQREISRLRGDLAHAEARLAVGPEDSDTFADNYGLDKGRPLGKHTRVTFFLGEPHNWTRQVDVQTGQYTNGDPFIEIHGGDGLAIAPSSSNVVRIYTTRL